MPLEFKHLAYDFLEVSLLNTYTSQHISNIIFLSETYLDYSSTLSRDLNLEIEECDLIRANQASSIKRSGVCIYYKNHLPMKLINVNFLHEYLTIELNTKSKLFVLVALYWSPSQSYKFSSFITSLECTLQAINLRKPFLTMVLGVFNPKNKLWFDQDNTFFEGSILNDLMAQYCLMQIIHEPMYIFNLQFLLMS